MPAAPSGARLFPPLAQLPESRGFSVPAEEPRKGQGPAGWESSCLSQGCQVKMQTAEGGAGRPARARPPFVPLPWLRARWLGNGMAFDLGFLFICPGSSRPLFQKGCTAPGLRSPAAASPLTVWVLGPRVRTGFPRAGPLLVCDRCSFVSSLLWVSSAAGSRIWIVPSQHRRWLLRGY